MAFFNLGCALCLVTLLLSLSQGKQQKLALGDTCFARDGVQYVCKLTEECPANKLLIQQGQSQRLRECSFHNKKEVSCCPVDTSPSTTTLPPSTTNLPFDLKFRLLPNAVGSHTELPQFGDTCVAQDGVQGVCKLTLECPANLLLIKQEQTERLRKCSFHKNQPVSCCPVDTSPSTTTLSPTMKRIRQPDAVGTPTEVPKFDDGCVLEDGSRGVCRRLTECPLPNIPPRQGSNSEKITSSQMCTEYAKYVNQKRYSNSLIGGNYDDNAVDETKCHVGAGTSMISDGEEAKLGEFPHMAVLGYGPEDAISWSCGGSLISPRFILTVAHCSSKADVPVRWVRLGDLDLNSPSDDENAVFKKVKRIIIHPSYRPPKRYNDIALLELESDVTVTSYVRPACLYTTPGDPERSSATATGWGKTDSNHMDGSDKLMKVDLLLLSSEDCSSRFARKNSETLPKNISVESMICAGADANKIDDKLTGDTCQGDSGGPLQFLLDTHYCMYSIVGLTSFGAMSCGYGKSASIYTRVSHYIPWIEENVWPSPQLSP